jgi:hypothetical protein
LLDFSSRPPVSGRGIQDAGPDVTTMQAGGSPRGAVRIGRCPWWSAQYLPAAPPRCRSPNTLTRPTTAPITPFPVLAQTQHHVGRAATKPLKPVIAPQHIAPRITRTPSIHKWPHPGGADNVDHRRPMPGIAQEYRTSTVTDRAGLEIPGRRCP